MFARARPFPSPSRSLPPEAPFRAERFVCFRGAPRLAPLCRRSSTGRVGPAPGPPCPLPFYLSLCCVVWCPSFVWCQASIFYSGRCGGGARGPSVVLRPRLCRADAGCRPMCPAPRPRPPLASALGRCALRLPVLGSLRSLRFKRACGGRSVTFRLAIARCGLSLAHFGARFCHFYMTKP